jgi:hypothetical protein
MERTRRCRVRISGPFGPFDGMDPDEMFEALESEAHEVREEEWDLTEDQVKQFLNDDGYAYVMTVFYDGKPRRFLTQKEIWEDPESFAPTMNDPNLTPAQKAAAVEERIRRSRAQRRGTP